MYGEGLVRLPACLSVCLSLGLLSCTLCRVKRHLVFTPMGYWAKVLGANVLVAQNRRIGVQSSTGVAGEQRFLPILLFWLNVVRCCPAGVLVRSFWRETLLLTVRLVYSRFQVVLVLLVMFTLVYAFYALYIFAIFAVNKHY